MFLSEHDFCELNIFFDLVSKEKACVRLIVEASQELKKLLTLFPYLHSYLSRNEAVIMPCSVTSMYGV